MTSWVSGCWLYRDNRYAWRPGYWNSYRDGWVWVPSHYVWTPNGVVFVAGYWDYPFPRRGVVFAPVWFPRPVYVRSGYCYSPSVVVDISRGLVHLFVYPRRCHYYWGDYYGFRPHGGHQFYAWYDYHGRHGYDPMFAYYTANYRRQNIDYAQRMRLARLLPAARGVPSGTHTCTLRRDWRRGSSIANRNYGTPC